MDVMNDEDRKILEDLEDQMKVEQVLDMAKKRRYNSIVITGTVEDQVEVIHYTDAGCVAAIGMLEMAKGTVMASMKADADDGE